MSVVFKCDRCTKVTETSTGRSKPDNWLRIVSESRHIETDYTDSRLICPTCARAYNIWVNDHERRQEALISAIVWLLEGVSWETKTNGLNPDTCDVEYCMCSPEHVENLSEALDKLLPENARRNW